MKNNQEILYISTKLANNFFLKLSGITEYLPNDA